MDQYKLAALHNELQKIAAARSMNERFGLEKVASETDVVEKMAQIELAHQRGEISDLEKEASMSLLRGIGGALRFGASRVGSMAGKMAPRMSKAYSGAATGAMAEGRGALRQTLAGIGGAGKAGLREFRQLGGAKEIGRSMQTGWLQRLAPTVARNQSLGMNTALGAGALGVGAGVGGMAMAGGGQQPQRRRYR